MIQSTAFTWNTPKQPMDHSAQRCSRSKNHLCSVPVDQCITLAGASDGPLTACHAQPTNQQTDIQCVGICSGSGELYGCMREISLMVYFLERRARGIDLHNLCPDVCVKDSEIDPF